MTTYLIEGARRCKRCTEPSTTPLCTPCLATVTSMSAWDEEWWTEVVGADGYEVSNLGRVRSPDQVVVQLDGRRRRVKGRVLKPTPRSQGYPAIPRFRQNKGVDVHTLVLEAFEGQRPRGTECRHLDDVKTNNRLANLLWGTHSENCIDKVRNGRDPNARKTHCRAGHEYSPENTVICERGDGRTFRGCRLCRLDRTREWRARNRRLTPD
jgi:hypothetical protein